MRFLGMIGTVVLSAGLPVAADATAYQFTATGTLAAFYTVDGNFNPIASPSTSLREGDAFRVTFTLETSGLAPESLYAADPTINIYYTQVRDLSFQIGSFSSLNTFGETNFSSVQLWDNHVVSEVGETDAFVISASRYISSSVSPVQLGAGQAFLDFGFSGFDFSAIARHSDDISEEPPFLPMAHSLPSLAS